MSALEIYLKAVHERKRIRRQYALQNLRQYIRTSTETELIKAIQRITNMDYLKILWEAGLTAFLQRVVSTRIEELMARRGE